MKNNIITLPDGYNGHTVKCFTAPLEETKTAVKLPVAEPGKECMFKWVYKEAYKRLAGA